MRNSKKFENLLPIKTRLQRYITIFNFVLIFIVLSALAATLFFYFETGKGKAEIMVLNQKVKRLTKELNELKNQDQYKINQELKERIDKTEDSYKKTAIAYEKILDLKAQKQDTDDLDKLFTQILNDLSTLNYTSASAKLTNLNSAIAKQYPSIASTGTAGPTVTATVSNTPPGSGYSYQAVKTDAGTFNVAVIAADMNSTRVIIDTASDHDCSNDCPVLPLGNYAARSGAFAAINGSFFCPVEYPSCAGKTNSFDTLLMNKNKVYFNSDNNVYSTVPAVIFLGGSVRFVGQSLEWGRDTGVDGVIANRPALIMGGNIVFSGEGEPKEGNRGNRSFVANKGNVVYIGVVHSASVAESAKVMKALGMDNALNLDNGGSTALWSGGYRVGPGRNIPNAILFVRK